MVASIDGAPITPLPGPLATDAMTALTAGAARTVDLAGYLIRPIGKRGNSAARGLWAALLNAPARGVRCRAIVDQYRKPAYHARKNDPAVAELAAAGWDVRRWKRTECLHAKLLLIDRKAAVVGSHNLTDTGLSRETELSLAVTSPEVLDELYRWHVELWRKSQT